MLPSSVVLSNFLVSPSNTSTRYCCSVSGLGAAAQLSFEVHSTTGHPRPSRSANWAALALLVPAMRAGSDLHIEGKVAPLLLHFLRTDLQSLLINLDPALNNIDVEAEILPLEDRPSGPQRVGTGFSAGIDSFSALRTFRQSGISSDFDVTDLMTFHVGAFGEKAGSGPRALFAAAAERTREYARKFEVEAHAVSSNLTSFYAGVPGLDFIRTHTLRNAAAASLFERELDIYLYASTFSYGEMDLRAKYDMAHVDPILLSLISTSDLRFVSSGAGNDRIRKTELLSSDDAVQTMLDVCVAHPGKRSALVGSGKNCSRCWKCARTMVTLDALGALERFGNVFDLAYYAERKADILSTVKHKGQKGSKLDQAAYEYHVKNAATATAP